MRVYPRGCAQCSVDPHDVARLLRRLEAAAREADRLGLIIFGGSGSGSVRYPDGGAGHVVVGDLDVGWWDGGDGACREDENGVLRGEV